MGGFGEVFLARTHTAGGLQQLVALKLLRATLDPQMQAVERLLDEARLLTNLNHPVILAAHDLVQMEDSRLGLVTEYVMGADLSSFLRSGPRLPPSTLFEIVEAVAGALHVAWSQAGIVHRDIKPANIRIGIHGNVKLIDFGIAHSDQMERMAETAEKELIGTIAYLAPERMRGGAIYASSDVFSLGCILYEGLVGAGFYQDIEKVRILWLSHDEVSYREHLDERLSVELPWETEQLLRSMLAWDPAERPSAEAVAQSCDTIRSGDPGAIPLGRFCRTYPWPEHTLRHAERYTSALMHPSGWSSPSSMMWTQPQGPRRSGLPYLVGCLGLSTLSILLVSSLLLVWAVLMPPLAEEPPAQASDGLAPSAGVASLDGLAPATPPTGRARPEGERALPPEGERPQVRERVRPAPVAGPSRQAVRSEPDPEVFAPAPIEAAPPGGAPDPVEAFAPEPVVAGTAEVEELEVPAEPSQGQAAATYTITFASYPLGAEVFLVGRGRLGVTGPLSVPLEADRSYQVQMVYGGQPGTVQTIIVGNKKPDLYIWDLASDSWRAKYAK